MTTRHYRSEDGITGYAEGDLLINDTTGEASRVVRDGRGLALQAELPLILVCACGIRHQLRPSNRSKRRGPYCCDVCMCGRAVSQ